MEDENTMRGGRGMRGARNQRLCVEPWVQQLYSFPWRIMESSRRKPMAPAAR